MTYTPIAKGTQNWDVPLNAALAQLDANITSGSSSALQAANNLSDLTNVIQARSNLGISAGVVQGVNSFNVKDYGALGNNTADDTAAIQAAINAAGTNGGQVYFPPGQYKLNTSAPLSNTHDAVSFLGSGVANTKIIIGSGFTGSAAITNTGNYFVFQNMSIEAASSTTTSNPACHGIVSTGGHTFRVLNASFLNINGYAIEAFGTATTQLHGGFVSHVKIQNTAGGIYIKSDSTQVAANFTLDNIFTRFVGVNSGTNANLDCIRIEDSWDVLVQNCFAWMNAATGGTGAAFRVVGNCAATFVQNLDALGPQTGSANVSLEAGANGSPQNVQITGGVIQQGTVGLNIGGATTQVRVNGVRFINNQTHGAVVSTTGPAIYLDSVFFSGNGAGATGTNYDLNWSGTTTGYVTNCRFASPIVTVGTAGVQQSINIAAAQNVRFFNVDFQGTGNSSANWFTNTPGIALETSSGKTDFLTTITANSGTRPIELQPSASGNTAFAVNISGNDAFDRVRMLGSGQTAYGSGTSARDTNTGRAAAGVFYTDKNMLVGSATALGDNGVGEIQLANATTVPTTNPTGGALIYSNAGSVQLRNAQGLVRNVVGTISGANVQTTVANTVTETAIATLTIPANDMVVGAAYRIKAWGTASTTGTPTMQFRALMGASPMASTGAITSTSGLSNKSWSVEAYVTVLTTGTSGTTFGHLDFPNAFASAGTGSPASATSVVQDGTASVTTNTTISNDFTIKFTWGTASSSNTLTCRGVIAERVA